MNCKQGDLAMFVRSYAGNEGKIVRCERFLPAQSFYMPDGTVRTCEAWEVDQPVIGFRGMSSKKVPDDQLRPIRDQPGEDEMIRIAGLPQNLKETA